MGDPVVALTKQVSGASLRGKTSHVRGSDVPVYAFLGVPYAQAPIGDLRFRPPAQLQLWQGTRDATQFGPACPQDIERATRSYRRYPNFPSKYSEDCLFLNIYTPCNGYQAAKLPVMVYIHGGAFVQGSSNLYDGSPLAAHENVVVITINYRLGVFGTLRTGSGVNDYHGNQGLLDQIEALRWVQRYVSNFGGDPNNVTVFGVSAGGTSVSYLTLSPLSKGLLHRAICQSGSNMTANSVWSSQGTEKYFWKRLYSFGYKGKTSGDLTRFLATKSTEDCLRTFSDWFVPSTLDGIYLPEEPLDTYTKGTFHHVDCITGFNSTEGVNFIPPLAEDREAGIKAIKQLVGKNFYRGRHPAVIEKVTELALAVYMQPGVQNPRASLSDFYGDVNFVAPALLQAEYHSKKARTYVYYFDHRPSFSTEPSWVRANHSYEVPFVFGFPYRTDVPEIWTEEEKKLSSLMMRYWASFARTGNPNSDSGPVWNQFSRDQPYYLPLETTTEGVKSAKDFFPERMNLWNRVVPAIVKDSTTSNAKL